MKYRTPIARAVGHGSAKEGSSHWWWQRITAVVLVPLTIWFVFSIAWLTGGTVGVVEWIGSPIVASLLITFIASLFFHAQLGVQVVIEDYIHQEGLKLLLVLTSKFVSIILVIASVISILRIVLS